MADRGQRTEEVRGEDRAGLQRTGGQMPELAISWRTGGSRDHLDGSFVDKIGSVELVVVVQPHDALANSFQTYFL